MPFSCERVGYQCMTIDMNDNHITSISQIQEVLKATGGFMFKAQDTVEKKYEWVGRTLGRLQYVRLSKKDKGIVKRYLIQITH